MYPSTDIPAFPSEIYFQHITVHGDLAFYGSLFVSDKTARTGRKFGKEFFNLRKLVYRPEQLKEGKHGDSHGRSVLENADREYGKHGSPGYSLLCFIIA